MGGQVLGKVHLECSTSREEEKTADHIESIWVCGMICMNTLHLWNIYWRSFTMESNKKVIRVVVNIYQDEEMERLAKKLSEEQRRFVSKSKLYRVAVKQFLRRMYDKER